MGQESKNMRWKLKRHPDLVISEDALRRQKLRMSQYKGIRTYLCLDILDAALPLLDGEQLQGRVR